jgi:PAS domain S-box-containing protein
MVTNQPPPDQETDFRRMVEHSPQLVSQHTRDGLFTFASPSFQRVLGYEPIELIGRSIYEFIHPSEVPRVRSTYVQARTHGDAQNITFRARHKNGQYVWLETVYQSVPGAQNVLAFGADGSRVRYLEDALRILARGTDTLQDIDFFRALVSQVAAALHMPFVFVTQHVENKSKVRMLAFWQGSDFGNPFEYGLAGTPCDDVINKGKACYYPIGVQSIFPNDRDLVALAAQGYIGIPIYDSNEEVIGHLAVLDSKPLVIEDRELNILKIFAARAGVEMERLHGKAGQKKSA